MATKRSAGEGSGLPPAKKLMTQFEPVKIGPVFSLEEMDVKVLQFQNRKFAERIEQRRKAEEELRKRIEQLEQRQTTDDAVLCIVNRFWNQLDEDVRVLLQRFDAEGADEVEKQNESPAVTSFLNLLSQWDKQETEDKLRQRVEFSERAIGKLLQAYDRLLQRKEKLWNMIKAKTSSSTLEESKDDIKLDETENEKDKKANDKDGPAKKESAAAAGIKEEPGISLMKSEDAAEETGEAGAEREVKLDSLSLASAIREEMDRLMEDNKRLQNMVTEIHQSHRELTLKNSELQDKVVAAETEVAELKNQVEDLEYHLASANHRVEKLDKHLSETMAKLKTYQEGEIKVQGGGEGVSKDKFNGILSELEEQRDLAATRLSELEKIQEEHQDALKQIERLKMDLSTLPESVIVETTEYKCLQSQFSVLYNESMQMKTQLEESRSILTNSKNAHMRQIEQMELEELAAQKKLRTEMIQMEDGHAQVRRECEMLRMEFEQTLAANEQTGPINREMRNLISSLKNHNEQLKAEIQRYKRKLKESQVEINKLRQDQQPSTGEQDAAPGTSGVNQVKELTDSSTVQIPHTKELRKDAVEDSSILCKEEDDKEIERECEKGKTDIDIIKDLKIELKKAQDKERDLKLLLDMYKCSSKDLREKAQIMAAEKKARMELEEARNQLRRFQDFDRKDKRKLADDEAIRKIKKLEETVTDLQKSLAAQKQEEETMLSEMEVTGQAFEDMQEQNVRLLQQLREKDDANFKLMSERIKSNQILKLLKEEKDTYQDQVITLQHQVEAQNIVVRKLEEKERILMSNLAAVEKELTLRQQALDMHKRKAVESAQTAADLKLHLDKYHAQLKEAQVAVADKTSALQQQSFKFKRIQEELATLRKKLDRAKKIEMASSADEVLMEEIREYKEQLTCPSCKVKKKDAVLTKCFHVFCLECLKTRYETRQRKCPKCNATFGANDYHRIYLE